MRSARYTYTRSLEGPWLLYDNAADPYQMANLIDAPERADTRDRLDSLMRDHMDRIDDRFLTKEAYYEQFGIELDARGKVAALVENMYDRAG